MLHFEETQPQTVTNESTISHALTEFKKFLRYNFKPEPDLNKKIETQKTDPNPKKIRFQTRTRPDFGFESGRVKFFSFWVPDAGL